MSNLKKAVETLKLRGLLPRDKNDKSAVRESSRPISEIEIMNDDSDIEEIIPDKQPQQGQTDQLDDYDDDEPILTDVVSIYFLKFHLCQSYHKIILV